MALPKQPRPCNLQIENRASCLVMVMQPFGVDFDLIAAYNKKNNMTRLPVFIHIFLKFPFKIIFKFSELEKSSAAEQLDNKQFFF